MKHISVVTFDCDGVMFDSMAANTAYYNQVLDHIGQPLMTPEQVIYAHMHTADEVIDFLVPGKEMNQRANSYRHKIGYLPFIRHMQIEPHLKTLLHFLRPRFKTAIATNRTNTMGHVLHEHDLEDQFDYVVTAFDVSRPKPNPEMLINILKFFNISSEQMLYVGDSELDAQAAEGAKVPFVAYNNTNLSAGYHVRTLLDLKGLLSNGSADA